MVTDEAPVTTESPPELPTLDVQAPAAPPPDATVEAPAATVEAQEPAEPPQPPEPPTEVAVADEPAPEPPSNKHWYVVKVQSGREETIREAIERKVKIEGLEEYYGQI